MGLRKRNVYIKAKPSPKWSGAAELVRRRNGMEGEGVSLTTQGAGLSRYEIISKNNAKNQKIKAGEGEGETLYNTYCINVSPYFLYFFSVISFICRIIFCSFFSLQYLFLFLVFFAILYFSVLKLLYNKCCIKAFV